MNILQIDMPNGSKWGVPVDVIARNRAEHYAHEYGGDIEKSLIEDTMPLFEKHKYEIEEWAENNMNWSDVKDCAKLLVPAILHEVVECNYQDGWINGDKKII